MLSSEIVLTKLKFFRQRLFYNRRVPSKVQ